VLVLVLLLAGYAGVYPFVSPALCHQELLAMQTQIDGDGVCLQHTSYTCGPAAAVTLLRRMGVQADESALALACGTSPAVGTPCDQLAEGIERLYPTTRCRFMRFTRASEVPENCLVVVRLGLFVDHYVAVLQTRPRIALGDPLSGKRTVSPAELERTWRGLGLVLEKRP
jgi:ABC-type bacteriocin/lantibiotic exporter with double-glycine peptidase domain